MSRDRFTNGLAIGLITGIALSVVFFLTLEISGISLKGGVTEWISAIAAGLTVIVSAAAVFFVVETLDATRKALDVTQGMANDTRVIGLNQVRAWVLVENGEVIDEHGRCRILINLKNYGLSPARSVKTEVVAYNDRYPFWARPIEELTDDFTVGVIPPSARSRVRTH